MGINMKISLKKLFSLFIVLNLVGVAQVPAYLPTNGLVGWWPFGGDANDYSGNNHNGVVNGATLTTDRFGSVNCAYSFNGSSNFISTNYAGILGNKSRAVSFWAKTTNSVSAMAAVSWGDNQFYPNTGKKFGCEFNYAYGGLTIDGADCAITYSAPSNFANNQWHHYVFQMDSAALLNQVKIYMDGVLATVIKENFRDTSTMSTVNGFNVHFGKMVYSLPYYFRGQLDDIAIWNRVLTPSEITSMFTGGSSCNYTGVLDKEIGEDAFRVYPNPSSDKLYITTTTKIFLKKQSQISIYSSDGKLVKKEQLDYSNQDENEIDIENLSEGFYIISVTNGEYQQNIKFIKN